MPRPTSLPGTSPPEASKGKKGKGKGKGKDDKGGKGAKGKAGGPCKFFGSAKGCTNDDCPFSHDNPNSGKDDKGGKGAKGKPAAKESSSVPRGTCKFFGSAWGCTNDDCPFLHDDPNDNGGNGAKGKPAAKESPSVPGGPCKFFGSAKGCSHDDCPFSHDNPNSVPPCSFKQKTGACEKGEACTFRHVPWASAEEARFHYASRESGSLETSQRRYKQLHRDNSDGVAMTKDDPTSTKVGKEHYEKPVEMELVVEKEMQEELYGSVATKMMAKMGYTTGQGLGKDEQGRKNLVGPALELERNSQTASLGVGAYTGSARSTVAERSARLADARAKKRQRVDEKAFVQHNLLSSDESSEGEEEHRKVRDSELQAA